jgi:hypothetical protein
MILTSIWNLIYIIRRSLLNNNNNAYGYKYFHVNDIQQNNKSIKYFESIDQFQETYQAFLHSFIQNYLSISDIQNISSNYCPPVPPDLQGPIVVNEVPDDFSLQINSSYHLDVKFGGYYQPKSCIARHKVAIIVPYRDREEILRHFLFHTHQILQRQQLDYRIFICEQAFNKTFNKGIVMNGCFKEILKLQPDTPCFVMHDVDLLLIDDRNMYTCPIFPRHLSVAIDKFQFYLPYTELVGGVLGMKYFVKF